MRRISRFLVIVLVLVAVGSVPANAAAPRWIDVKCPDVANAPKATIVRICRLVRPSAVRVLAKATFTHVLVMQIHCPHHALYHKTVTEPPGSEILTISRRSNREMYQQMIRSQSCMLEVAMAKLSYGLGKGNFNVQEKRRPA